MTQFPWLPQLPAWVPYPLVVWFVVEGIALGVIGFLVREFLGQLVPGALTIGNVVLFVGVVTAGLGAFAYLLLIVFNR